MRWWLVQVIACLQPVAAGISSSFQAPKLWCTSVFFCWQEMRGAFSRLTRRQGTSAWQRQPTLLAPSSLLSWLATQNCSFFYRFARCVLLKGWIYVHQASQVTNRDQFAVTSVTIEVMKRSRNPPRFDRERYEGFIYSTSIPESMVLRDRTTNRPFRVRARDEDFATVSHNLWKLELLTVIDSVKQKRQVFMKPKFLVFTL